MHPCFLYGDWNRVGRLYRLFLEGSFGERKVTGMALGVPMIDRPYMWKSRGHYRLRPYDDPVSTIRFAFNVQLLRVCFLYGCALKTS